MDKGSVDKFVELAKKYDLMLLVLFGSRSQNVSTEKSDWDFAYFSSQIISAKEHKEIAEELSKIVDNDKIDLININVTFDPLLRKDILVSGKCLYERRKGLFEEYANRAWFDYIDFKPNYKIMKDMIKKRLEGL